MKVRAVGAMLAATGAICFASQQASAAFTEDDESARPLHGVTRSGAPAPELVEASLRFTKNGAVLLKVTSADPTYDCENLRKVYLAIESRTTTTVAARTDHRGIYRISPARVDKLIKRSGALITATLPTGTEPIDQNCAPVATITLAYYG